MCRVMGYPSQITQPRRVVKLHHRAMHPVIFAPLCGQRGTDGAGWQAFTMRAEGKASELTNDILTDAMLRACTDWVMGSRPPGQGWTLLLDEASKDAVAARVRLKESAFLFCYSRRSTFIR